MSIVAASFTGPNIAFTDLLPLLVWLGATCGLLLLGSLVPKWPKGWYAGVAVLSSVVPSVTLPLSLRRTLACAVPVVPPAYRHVSPGRRLP